MLGCHVSPAHPCHLSILFPSVLPNTHTRELLTQSHIPRPQHGPATAPSAHCQPAAGSSGTTKPLTHNRAASILQHSQPPPAASAPHGCSPFRQRLLQLHVLTCNNQGSRTVGGFREGCVQSIHVIQVKDGAACSLWQMLDVQGMQNQLSCCIAAHRWRQITTN